MRKCIYRIIWRTIQQRVQGTVLSCTMKIYTSSEKTLRLERNVLIAHYFMSFIESPERWVYKRGGQWRCLCVLPSHWQQHFELNQELGPFYLHYISNRAGYRFLLCCPASLKLMDTQCTDWLPSSWICVYSLTGVTIWPWPKEAGSSPAVAGWGLFKYKRAWHILISMEHFNTSIWCIIASGGVA